MKLERKFFGFNLVEAILMVVFGLVLIIKPEQTITIVSNLIGLSLIVIGILSIVKYLKFKIDFDMFTGIVSCVLGLILVLNPGTIISVLPFILGIYFIIRGISKFKYSLDLKKYNGNYLTSLIVSILIIICGTSFVVNPFQGAVHIIQIIGIFMVIYSVLNFIDYFTIKNKFKEIEKVFNNDK